MRSSDSLQWVVEVAAHPSLYKLQDFMFAEDKEETDSDKSNPVPVFEARCDHHFVLIEFCLLVNITNEVVF